MRNAGLDEAQAGIKIARRNINNLRYSDDTTLMAESEEELKSLLMKVKGENEKVGLKLNIQKMKIMASSSITSWQIDGETVETVTDFIFWGSKITADGDCSHEIKRHLLLGRKAMTNLFFFFESQSCLTPCHPTDYTVHGILQARILEWVAFPFYRGSSQHRDQTQVSHLNSIFKSRGIILPTKFHLVKAMVFAVVIYGCESWTIKKAVH